MSGTTANTYSGTTTVNAGEIDLNKTAGVTAIPGNLVVGDGTGAEVVKNLTADQIADTSAVTINVGSTLNLNNNNDAINTLTMTDGSARPAPAS